ncbi:MAG: adenylate/guanylate cyclase domain-containing protein [Pseudomonadota bacterium]|nr:adenylate/guanylate cyclase domain-containing protein [Pseudomonadota bacterium]
MLDRLATAPIAERSARSQRMRRLVARLSYWVVVGLAIFVAAPWALVESSERVAVQNLLFDEFQRWRPRVSDAPPPIRVVEIDDASIAKLGRWPWPRARLAEMIEKIADAGAAVVALDVLLYDPGDPQDDARLAQAIQGRPVVLGQFFTNDGNAPRLAEKAGFAFAGDDPTRYAYGFRGAMTPLPIFAQAAAGVGFLNWLPDNDRVVRRVPLVLDVNGRLTPAFALEALRVAQGASSYTVKSSNASGEFGFGAHTGMVAIRDGDAVAQTGPRGDFRIHFAGDDPRIRVSAASLFAPGADLSVFAGKIVFIGVSAQLLYDIVATPLSPAAPGVVQHAEIAGQILMNDRLSRPDWAPGAEFLYTLALSAVLAISLPLMSTLGGTLIGLVAAAGSLAGSWWAFSRAGLLLDPIMPSVASGFVYFCGVLALFARKQSEAREIRSAFGRYVSPTVVAKLTADPSVLRLGGEERRVTLMFSDLRGFTTLSEGKTATELTRFLNEYLTPMTDIVLQQRGTVDKYIGDAIMAFWNAPLDDARHAAHAVEAALAMREALSALNAQWLREAQAAGRPFKPVKFGLGLNTGEACVGNLGSLRRFDYSVIGDEVNVASRLESASKQFGVDIVASEATRAEASKFAWLEVDAVVFKNKTHPVGVFALVGDAELAASAEFAALASGHARMMALYRARDFTAARELASELETQAPAAARGLYGYHLRRFNALEAAAPPENWDAVMVLDEK